MQIDLEINQKLEDIQEPFSVPSLDQQEKKPTHSKKDKRNRKFFLKRINTLILVNANTGELDILNDQDLTHIEILQGGHAPLAQKLLTDISQENYRDDHECLQGNLFQNFRSISKKLFIQYRKSKKPNIQPMTQIAIPDLVLDCRRFPYPVLPVEQQLALVKAKLSEQFRSMQDYVIRS